MTQSKPRLVHGLSYSPFSDIQTWGVASIMAWAFAPTALEGMNTQISSSKMTAHDTQPTA